MSNERTECYNCFEMVRVEARKCPHCGKRRPSKTEILAGGFLAMLFGLGIVIVYWQYNPGIATVSLLAMIVFLPWFIRKQLQSKTLRQTI